MIILYRFLFLPIFTVILLKNLPKMFKRGGYGKDLGHRFGFLPYFPKSKKKRLWIQGVSVGEINAVTGLVNLLSREYEVVLTTTTTTARKIIADKLSKNVLFHGYFPWDFWPLSLLAWRRVQPDAVILVESELWPEHMWQARKRRVPIFLVNARLSDRSFRRYAYFLPLGRWIFGQVDFVAASSEENRKKITALYGKKIELFGNINFDLGTPLLSPTERKNLKRELGFREDTFVIMGCSTWPGEEELLLEALRKIREKTEKKKYGLLLVPRHVERRRELVKLLEGEKLSFSQRSLETTAQDVDVCLADTTGELPRLVQVADVAFIGKSLPPNDGGQSPLEAAMAGVPIVYGNRMTNFRDICSQLERENAALKVESEGEAVEAIVELSENTQRRQLLAQNIGRWFSNNRGASEKTYAFIRWQLEHFS
jgi:3-deoxy-D-manno-octulosonic-acid transferase